VPSLVDPSGSSLLESIDIWDPQIILWRDNSYPVFYPACFGVWPLIWPLPFSRHWIDSNRSLPHNNLRKLEQIGPSNVSIHYTKLRQLEKCVRCGHGLPGKRPVAGEQ
jgi:hypothetical protein